MRRNLYILAIASLLSGNYVFAQDAVKQWSLEECIQYAIEHNIDLKQKEQEQESRKVDLHTSKYSWLPALNGSLGQSFQFGRSTSKSGVIVDQNAANSTLGINLDMPLFDGLKIPNDIAARKLDLKASIENLNKAREDLSINIASYYLQVLYNKELLKIAQLQVELDKEQVNKTEAMVNAGKVPLSQLYDIKAQLAKDEVTLTESQNNVNLALLDLAQSLELERSDRSFDIQTPVIEDAVADNMSSILPPENIYDHAVTFKPQIKEQQYLLESQKKMLRVAQAGYYPKLNFGASYSNGYPKPVIPYGRAGLALRGYLQSVAQAQRKQGGGRIGRSENLQDVGAATVNAQFAVADRMNARNVRIAGSVAGGYRSRLSQQKQANRQQMSEKFHRIEI